MQAWCANTAETIINIHFEKQNLIFSGSLGRRRGEGEVKQYNILLLPVIFSYLA